MAVYVLLEFDNDDEAKKYVQEIFVKDVVTISDKRWIVRDFPARVRAVYKKPTLNCECGSRGRNGKGFTRGKKYGWWVCGHCGKPTKQWAGGNSWYTALGTNLLPVEVAPEYRPPEFESPMEWRELLPEDQQALRCKQCSAPREAGNPFCSKVCFDNSRREQMEQSL